MGFNNSKLSKKRNIKTNKVDNINKQEIKIEEKIEIEENKLDNHQQTR